MNFAQSTSCDAYFYYITKDYHVIFLYQTSASGTLVTTLDTTLDLDLDTTLTFPCDLKQYYEEAIKDNKSLKPEYHRYIVGSMLIQIQILFFNAYLANISMIHITTVFCPISQTFQVILTLLQFYQSLQTLSFFLFSLSIQCMKIQG